MRPQDILVLLKMVSLGQTNTKKIDLAESLGLSPGEITFSLERSRRARLIDEEKKMVNTQALFEFLIHGIQYVYPIELGATQRGIPTSVYSPVMNGSIAQGSQPYVWPTPKGTVRGTAVSPLYKTVPEAADKDTLLYEMLALTDCLRMGRVREKEIASLKLKSIFEQYNDKH